MLKGLTGCISYPDFNIFEIHTKLPSVSLSCWEFQQRATIENFREQRISTKCDVFMKDKKVCCKYYHVVPNKVFRQMLHVWKEHDINVSAEQAVNPRAAVSESTEIWWAFQSSVNYPLLFIGVILNEDKDMRLLHIFSIEENKTGSKPSGELSRKMHNDRKRGGS